MIYYTVFLNDLRNLKLFQDKKMKILALDLGDKWVGTAISDPLGMFARPYRTVELKELDAFLAEVIKLENIKKIIIGYPKTMKGTKSEQTKKVEHTKGELEKKFDMVPWELWDERLSSKRAEVVKKTKTKEDKKFSHSIAAAFILDSYLTYLQAHKSI